MTWKTPALTDCDAGIEPTEYMALVAMAEFEAKTAGGILLTDATREKEGWGSTHARLLALSPLAFSYERSWPETARKPQVGDVVFVGKYPGEEVVGRDGKTYRLISDREISGIIERARHIEPPITRSEELERQVEALFATVGSDTDGALTPAQNFVVSFANGSVKNQDAPTAPMPADVLEATVEAIKAQFPDHAARSLHWRRRPELTFNEDGTPRLYLRLGADKIERADAQQGEAASHAA